MQRRKTAIENNTRRNTFQSQKLLPAGLQISYKGLLRNSEIRLDGKTARLV